MRLLILLSIFILSSCGKTLPVTQVRSLSGKDYHGPNSRISLIRDFDKGAMFLINHSIKAPGGMFFSTMDFGLTPYGAELYFFDDATGTSSLVADIEPGGDSSSVSNFSDPGGDWIYFLAKTEDRGREIHRVHKTTFIVEELPEGQAGSSDSFQDCEQQEKCFIVIQENPVVAYGKRNFQTSPGVYKDILFEYEYDGTSVTEYGELVTAVTNPGNAGVGVYVVDPKMMNTMFGNQSSTATPMLVLSEENDVFVVRLPNGDLIEYSHINGNIKDIVILRDGADIIKAPIMIAQPNGGGDEKLWVYTYSGGTSDPITLETIYGVGTDFMGKNIKEMTVHNDKLYFVADFKAHSCTAGVDPGTNPTCSPGSNLGQEVGIYDPIGYEYWETKGFEVIDLKPGVDDSESASLTGAGIFANGDDRLCLAGWDGTDGYEVHCINTVQTQAYVNGGDRREYTYSISEYDIRAGADNTYPHSLTYLNGSLVFNGRRDADTFGIYHLNLSTGVHKTSGPSHPLYTNDDGDLTYNRFMLHSSHKYSFEIMMHDLLGGQVINDQGVYLDFGLTYKKTSEFDASSNDTGLPLLRFIKSDLLYGSNFLNKEYSWTYNESTKEYKEYIIGGAISEDHLEYNGRVYFPVNHRGRAALAWINPVNGTSDVIKKSCHDITNQEYCAMLDADGNVVGENDETDYLGVAGTFRILMEHKGYIYYVARGESDTKKTIYRYDPVADVVFPVGQRTLSQVKILFNDTNMAIVSGYDTVSSQDEIFFSLDGGTTVTNLEYAGQQLLNYQDHYTEDDALVLAAFRQDGATGYGLLKLDLSDTSTFSNSDVSLLSPVMSTSADTHLLLKKENELLVVRKDNQIYKYNKTSNTISSQGLSGTFTTNIRGDDVIIFEANTLSKYNVYGTKTDEFDLSALTTSCALNADNYYLIDNFVFEHCSNSDFSIHFRSTNQKIDLTAFGMGWTKAETRYKILLENDEKTVVSFMRVDTGNPDDVQENKVIEISHTDNSFNFVFDESFDLSKMKVGDGQFLTCEVKSEDYAQLVKYDFRLGKTEAISGDHSCIGSSDFYEVIHMHNNSLKGLLKFEDHEETLGYELYEIKL